jgi:predicted pyridoxine 5'-phosphate oxidase superfamily flavin-nucleotide-binding protein
MINNALKKMIEENILGLATADKLGNPHNIAVGHVKVVSESQLVISDNYLDETLKNIEKNPNVSLVVWHSDWKKACIGYELKGSAEYFTEGEWVDFIKKIPVNKEEPCKGAVLVTINKTKLLHEKWNDEV